jgi:hypothetical protein
MQLKGLEWRAWIKTRGIECIRTLCQPVGSSQDDVFGFICPDSGMRPVSFREHVGLKGSSIYAELTVTDSRAANMPPRPVSAVLHNFVSDRGSHLKRLSSAPRHSADADLRESHAERYKSHPPRPIESHGGVDRRSHTCRLF